MSQQWDYANLMKEAKKWYNGEKSIISLDKQLLHCLFRLSVLIDQYETKDSTIHHSFENPLNYLERQDMTSIVLLIATYF